jgi:quercetin dioxygenase-like cupin family protein
MELALLEDDLEEGGRLALDAADRVVYVARGAAAVEAAATAVSLAEGHAWSGPGACVVRARPWTRVWRWELRRDARGLAVKGATTLKLSRPIDLPDAALLRADRVDFPPRGIAYTHVHQGPGIRVLLCGRLRVETNGRTLELHPGEAWFERGPDPVYAEVVGDEPTSFVRVMVLPVGLLGQSSIRYVKAEDQARPKSQRYTVLVDVPIAPG